MSPRYRFGFILNIHSGNMTRYVNLRKFAEKDPEVQCHWTPVSGYPPPSVEKFMSFLPRLWISRFWIFWQLLPALRQLATLDAMVIHLFEAETICALRPRFFRSPILVSSTDEAPIVDESRYPLFPFQLAKSRRRRAFRLRLDRWRLTRMDLFIPFSEWVGNILVKECGVPAEKVFPIHVGIDLGLWSLPSDPTRNVNDRLKILFVGGDFKRKGGDLLLEVFVERFANVAELHIVSGEAPEELPAHVYVHQDLTSNDGRLIRLYSDCDLLAVPSTADLIPWVFIEAMAMGRPAIGTDVGAIAEIVEHGRTGFIVAKGDQAALGDRIQQLLDDPALRREMGRRGRERVERLFDASKNVSKMLSVIKKQVCEQRAAE